eukprot:snap_masked-scaffold_87-processed-gene-0.12-mRNA-1 protein AED:0.02 eAED:0.03 QI:0/0/0/1/1/1/2/0/325
MKKTVLGTGESALEVSCIGYGAMEEESLRVLKTAFDSGIRHFDTAQMYVRFDEEAGIVYNEELIGKFLKTLNNEERKEVSVATKYFPAVLQSFSVTNFDEEEFKQACNSSLERLGVDCIDLYYCHRIFPSNISVKTWMNGFKKLVEEGKIKRVGLSEASAEIITQAHKIYPITCIQQEWSIFVRDLEEEIVPLCKQLGIGIVAYSPMGRGFLAGKFSENKPEGFRSSVPFLNQENIEKNKLLLEEIKGLAELKNCGINQICLAWVMKKGGIPIPGSANLEHVKSNCDSWKVDLSETEMSRLDEIGKKVNGLRGDAEYMMFAFNNI